MNIIDIFTATIGGIFTLLLLMVLASYVGAFISAGMHNNEEDEHENIR